MRRLAAFGLGQSGATCSLLESKLTGLVLRVDAKRCHVDVGGQVYLLSPRGKLFESRGTAKNPVAVGDRVEVTLDGDGGGSIERVLERSTKLARASAGEGTREQVLVANVDQALIISSMRAPEFRPALVDRILAGAERGGIAPRIVMNKIDNEDAASTGAHSSAHWIAFYERLGYPGHRVSAQTGEGVEALRGYLANHITVFCGLSGVGKSSLLNAIEPGLALRVGNVSKRGVREGRHTTTHSALLRLECGGYVVDTPGIRNFGLFGLAEREVAALFPELRVHLGSCAFDDCLHTHEPHCAIKAARDRGEITASRYASYVELLEDAHSGAL